MSKKNNTPANTGDAAPERTKRGDDDRKKEDGKVTGAPAGPGRADDDAARPKAAVTRDKGATPAKESAGDDDAAE